MGLLSFLQRQQQPYLGSFQAPAPFDPSAVLSAPIPGAYQPQQPQLFGGIQMPTYQPPTFPTAPPQQQQPPRGFGAILQRAQQPLGNGALSPLDLMMGGMSMLGAAQPFGGGWGAAAQGLGGVVSTAQQRQRQQRQDDREESIWGRQQTQWSREDQERQALEQWVGSLPPDQQAAARANPELAYRAFMEAQAQANAPITPFERERLDLQREELAATERLGRMRGSSQRPEGSSRYWTRPTGRDAILMQDYEGAVQNARSALIGLDRLENLFKDLIGRDATGQPIPANMRRTISRITQTDPAARAIMEQIDSQIWPLVLQNLDGLAPVTNVELGQALNRTVNADMTPEAALAEIQRMRQEAQRAQDLGLRAYDFAQEAGSLVNGRNEAGQNWLEYSGGAFSSPGGAQQQQRSSWPAGAPPPPEAVAQLRRDSSLAARREFEQMFNLEPGGAQRYLIEQPRGTRRTQVRR